GGRRGPRHRPPDGDAHVPPARQRGPADPQGGPLGPARARAPGAARPARGAAGGEGHGDDGAATDLRPPGRGASQDRGAAGRAGGGRRRDRPSHARGAGERKRGEGWIATNARPGWRRRPQRPPTRSWTPSWGTPTG